MIQAHRPRFPFSARFGAFAAFCKLLGVPPKQRWRMRPQSNQPGHSGMLPCTENATNLHTPWQRRNPLIDQSRFAPIAHAAQFAPSNWGASSGSWGSPSPPFRQGRARPGAIPLQEAHPSALRPIPFPTGDYTASATEANLADLHPRIPRAPHRTPTGERCADAASKTTIFAAVLSNGGSGGADRAAKCNSGGPHPPPRPRIRPRRMYLSLPPPI